MPRKITPSRHERGQSLIELALSMTLMLIVLAGIVDIGRAFFTYITMRDAAQEGALYAEFAFAENLSSPISTVCSNIMNRVTGSNLDLSGKPTMVDLGNSSVISIEFADKGTNTWVTCNSLTSNPVAGDSIRITIDNNGFTLTTPFLGTLIGSQNVKITTSIKDIVLAPSCKIGINC